MKKYKLGVIVLGCVFITTTVTSCLLLGAFWDAMSLSDSTGVSSEQNAVSNNRTTSSDVPASSSSTNTTIAAGGDIYPEYLVRAKLELDSSAETVNKFKPDHPMLYHVVFTKEQWLGTGNARRQFGVSPKSEIGDSPIYKGSFADSYCEETITFLYNGKKTTCIGYNTYTYQDGYMDMDKYIAWWVNDYNAVLDLDNIKEEKDITVPKSIKNVMDTYHKDMILLLDYSISEYTQIIIYNYDAGNRSYWKRIYHVYK